MLILYVIAPKKFKNFVLFISSLFFYAWGEPKYVFLMLATIICGFFLGLLIEKYREKTLGRLFLVISIVLSLGTLALFKYADFFIGNFVRCPQILSYFEALKLDNFLNLYITTCKI